ncbi:hypothetical protein PC9H_000978 [Pleurotus ostreatus]|uniref:Uncharacterized protein n=1 Tax=Pleurotus ostreatus TaxID=5322 RepID=A0A8H7DX33_PLEOS|nr:uncharacterized protein PC9H_000978 [Pleurotus ostreatus]KAF7440632.1 hypothetical protein PC9H_000978 [Pleurotus ostreatus]
MTRITTLRLTLSFASIFIGATFYYVLVRTTTGANELVPFTDGVDEAWVPKDVHVDIQDDLESTAIPPTLSPALPTLVPDIPRRKKHKVPKNKPIIHYLSPAPKLTIIAIWNPSPDNKEPIYLPNFFASVAANPSIDLLFIKYDRHRVGTPPCEPSHVKNMRQVCLSFEEYWKLHADFLCKRWGGCSTTQRQQLVSKLHERAPGDRVNSYFRPFRAAVFAKWINPETPIWGWCDMDTILGSFERNFPWDIASEFDFLFPGPPIDGGDILLFFPGHMAFFKNKEHVVSAFMDFPNLKTYESYMDLPWVSTDTEECEYSHFALAKTKLTFLRFPGIVHSRIHFSSITSGVFATENPGHWLAVSAVNIPSTSSSSDSSELDPLRSNLAAFFTEHTRNWVSHPTFSEEGKEYDVELREGEWEGWLWFPKQYAVHYTADRSKGRQEDFSKRYTMRRPSGKLYDRTEPYRDSILEIPTTAYTPLGADPVRSGASLLVFDMLYNHFQAEKYAKWWSLPKDPIAAEELLFVDRENGAQLWDPTGKIIFEVTSESKPTDTISP